MTVCGGMQVKQQTKNDLYVLSQQGEAKPITSSCLLLVPHCTRYQRHYLNAPQDLPDAGKSNCLAALISTSIE